MLTARSNLGKWDKSTRMLHLLFFGWKIVNIHSNWRYVSKTHFFAFCGYKFALRIRIGHAGHWAVWVLFSNEQCHATPPTAKTCKLLDIKKAYPMSSTLSPSFMFARSQTSPIITSSASASRLTPFGLPTSWQQILRVVLTINKNYTWGMGLLSNLVVVSL
jgi:hypothetical protein